MPTALQRAFAAVLSTVATLLVFALTMHSSPPAATWALALNVISYVTTGIVVSALMPDTSVSIWTRRASVLMLALGAVTGVHGAYDEFTQTSIPIVDGFHRLVRITPYLVLALSDGAGAIGAATTGGDGWRFIQLSEFRVAIGLVVVGTVGAATERTVPPQSSPPWTMVVWGASMGATILSLTPARRVWLSVRLGLGLRHVGLGEFNSVEVRRLLHAHTRAEAAAAKARMLTTLEAALHNAAATRAAATREWHEEGRQRRALHALAENARRRTGGARSQRGPEQRPHPRSRARLVHASYVAEAEARRLIERTTYEYI